MKKFLHACSSLYTVFMLGLLLLTLSIRMGGGNALGPYQFRVVLTESMQNTFPVGSLLISKQVPIEEVKEEDVISMSVGGTVLSHRVVHKFTQDNHTVFQTKGDSNQRKDPFIVKEQQVLGKAVLAIPWIGKILLKLQTINGKIAFGLFLIEIYLLKVFIQLIWS